MLLMWRDRVRRLATDPEVMRSSIATGLFADDCLVYREIINRQDQIALPRIVLPRIQRHCLSPPPKVQLR